MYIMFYILFIFIYIYIYCSKRLHCDSDTCQTMELTQLTNHPRVQDKGLARSLPFFRGPYSRRPSGARG